MRVVHQSPTELVVKDSSVWMTILFAAIAVALAIGIETSGLGRFLAPAVFLVFRTITARTTTFTFDGMQRTVHWSGFKPFKAESGTILFDKIDAIALLRIHERIGLTEAKKRIEVLDAKIKAEAKILQP